MHNTDLLQINEMSSSIDKKFYKYLNNLEDTFDYKPFDKLSSLKISSYLGCYNTFRHSFFKKNRDFFKSNSETLDSIDFLIDKNCLFSKYNFSLPNIYKGNIERIRNKLQIIDKKKQLLVNNYLIEIKQIYLNKIAIAKLICEYLLNCKMNELNKDLFFYYVKIDQNINIAPDIILNLVYTYYEDKHEIPFLYKIKSLNLFLKTITISDDSGLLKNTIDKCCLVQKAFQ
ncbi:MAG: hypothetical protein GY830_11280 [Bacteroidetes bacterium]|nr:hypothetical protein [Bacteroidota bacterium]